MATTGLITSVKVNSGAVQNIASSAYGECTTAAATAAKTVAMTGFVLVTGITIHVKFTNSNTVASPTLDVNGTGAKYIKKYGTTAPGTSTTASWYAGAVLSFTYDGTYWQMNDWLNIDTNDNTTQNVEARDTIAVCSTGGGTAAKTATLGYFELRTGIVIKIRVVNPNTVAPTDSTKITMNVNSTGAKNIYVLTGDNTWAIISAANQLPAGTYYAYYDTYWYMLNCGTSATAGANNTTGIHISDAFVSAMQAGYGTKNVFVNGFKKAAGAKFRMYVQSNSTYTQSGISLNVNRTDAETIYVNNVITSTTFHTLDAGWYDVTYDGVNYRVSNNTSSLNFNILDGGNYNSRSRLSKEQDANYSLGQCATTLGWGTQASGTNAMAIGYNTKAYGPESLAEGNYTESLGSESHAEGSYSVAYGDVSHAEGYQTFAFGSNSHSEGIGYTASRTLTYVSANTFTLQGDYHNYEGAYIKYSDTYYKIDSAVYDLDNSNKTTFTIAIPVPSGTTTISTTFIDGQAAGAESHSEGYRNKSIGLGSHAEGLATISIGQGSHTEGGSNIASSNYAHAEGQNTSATGIRAHAEGYDTKALGSESHAQGRGTIAASAQQFVAGMYNVEDTQDTYAEIIGNGSAPSRSNARTLDWLGNEKLAGGIKLGSTGTGGVDLKYDSTKKLVASYDNGTTLLSVLGRIKVSASSGSSYQLKYNNYTVLTISANTTLTLEDTNTASNAPIYEYSGEIIMGSTLRSITWPSTVTKYIGPPIVANKTYLFSILNDSIIICEK